MAKARNQELKLNLPPLKGKELGFPVSLLKSAVQKCIRRGDVARAVKCAKLFIRKKPLDFWRRLPIILLDDVLLHPQMMRIVRLATEIKPSKYLLPANEAKRKADEEFGLQVVEQAARCQARDFEFVYYLYGRKDITSLPSIDRITGVSDKEAELVEALLLRRNLFGMAGDMRMLETSARLWLKRFRDKGISVADLEKMYPKPKLDYRRISDRKEITNIPLEAVDFHCTGIVSILLAKGRIVELLQEEWGEMTQAEMKKKLERIFWDCRSGINLKEDITTGRVFDQVGSIITDNDPAEREKIRKTYEKIKTEIDSVSRYIIKSSFNN